jgi:hypothetical protein
MYMNDNIQQEIDGYIDIIKEDQPQKAYETCARLSDCTKQLIDNRDKDVFAKCLSTLNNVYAQVRCSTVKQAIENVFLYKLSDVIMLRPDRRDWMHLLPESLKDKIYQQLYASGI